jgi:hypothetical protein
MTKNGRDGKMSETMFGKLIKEGFVSQETGESGEGLVVSEHRHTMAGMKHRFDYKKLINGMENLHLLAPGECRIDEGGCLIKMENDE